MEFRILPVTPLQQNCTLIWCQASREAAIVDPGGELPRILALLEALRLRPRQILLTHGHLDHVGGAAELAERLGAAVWGPHPDDAFLLDALPEQCALFGFSPLPALRPDRWLNDGDRLSLGELELEVIHTPGHTPGHLVYFNRAAELAQVGDVLFCGAIGRTDFPRGNHRALLDAIHQRLLPLGDSVRFIPGHGPMSTFGEERRNNPYLTPC